MQPRSMVMAPLLIAVAMLSGGYHTSEAKQNEAVPRPSAPTPQPIPTKIPAVAVSAPSTNSQPRLDLAVYRVQSGDTLFEIAVRHNTKIEHILKYNPQLDPENLAIGQVLQVPKNTVIKQKTREEMAESAAKMVLTQTGEPSSYIKMIPCKLTAYSNSYESTGKNPGEPGYGITASGRPAKEGYTIAVDPALIPMHSIVYIPGIGVRYAEDTGGAVKGSHIDVFFNDDSTCRDFGVKQANVYLLEEGRRES